MNKNIFLSYLFVAIVALAFPGFVQAQGNSTDPLPPQSEGCNEQSSEHSPHCDPVAVPEFGFLAGAIALIGSTGSYLAFRLKKRV